MERYSDYLFKRCVLSNIIYNGVLTINIIFFNKVVCTVFATLMLLTIIFIAYTGYKYVNEKDIKSNLAIYFIEYITLPAIIFYRLIIILIDKGGEIIK